MTSGVAMQTTVSCSTIADERSIQRHDKRNNQNPVVSLNGVF